MDAIWITPCYPSPQVDFGYDVSDYENIDPMYGTLNDFDRMVAEGKKARHPHHHGFCAEPHLRPAQLVPGFEVFAHRRRIATGTSGATAKRPASRPITGSPSSAVRPGQLDPKTEPVLLPLFLSRSSPTSTGAIPPSKKPCSMSRAGGTSAALPDSAWMPWTRCSKIRTCTTIPSSRQERARRSQHGEQIQRRSCPRCTTCCEAAQGRRRIQRRPDRRNLDCQLSTNSSDYYGEQRQ